MKSYLTSLTCQQNFRLQNYVEMLSTPPISLSVSSENLKKELTFSCLSYILLKMYICDLLEMVFGESTNKGIDRSEK